MKETQGYPGLLSKFEASLGGMRPRLNNQTSKQRSLFSFSPLLPLLLFKTGFMDLRMASNGSGLSARNPTRLFNKAVGIVN